jgi:predicted Zn-dependent peptidase
MEFIETKLKNGVSLYMMPIAGIKSVACGAMINVGSRDELNEKEFGLAHALEHMPLFGTKKFPSPFLLSNYIEEVGGFRNAMTNKDRTLFYNKVPDYEIERSIDWLHEVLEEPLLLEDDLISSKKIIIEEIKKSSDNPEKYFFDFSSKNLYANHPLAHPILGSEESVKNLQISDLLDFYKKFYNLNNYTFFIAGNFENEKVLGLFEKYFKNGNNGVKNVRNAVNFSAPVQKNFIGIKDFKQSKIKLSFFIPQLSLEDKITLLFFANVLSGGSASPLYQELRIKRNLVYSVSTSYYIGIDIGSFSVSINTSFKDYKEIKKIIVNVIENTKNDQKRFEQTKKRMLGNLSFSFESPFNIIIEAASDKIYLGKPMGYEENRKMIKVVSLERIKFLVDKYFNEDNLYLNVLMSEK